MKKLLTITGLFGGLLAGLHLRSRSKPAEYEYTPTRAVEPDRPPGVPPESVDDVNGSQEDLESAQSFPASDPPGNY